MVGRCGSRMPLTCILNCMCLNRLEEWDINSYWVGQIKGPNMEKMDKEIKTHKTKVLRETPLPTLRVLLAWLVHKSVPFPGYTPSKGW